MESKKCLLFWEYLYAVFAKTYCIIILQYTINNQDNLTGHDQATFKYMYHGLNEHDSQYLNPIIRLKLPGYLRKNISRDSKWYYM